MSPLDIFSDPYTAAILISFVPIGMLTVYVLATGSLSKHALYFFLFTITLTQFYIVAIDPSLAAGLYTTKGNYWFPTLIALLSGALLIVAYYFGKKTEENLV